MRKAAELLFFQRHIHPGAKGWELKKALGRNYMRVIELLDAELEKFGLRVKIVEEESPESSRFFITSRDPVKKGGPWKIDDVAVLAVSIAYIVSRGKVERKAVEQILKEKFPAWKVESNLNRFIRLGYLSEDEEGILRIGWRAKAEIDERILLTLIVSDESQ
ncbi:MAG: hypothetical protein ACXQT5_05435 [Candidatus Syntropharchaeia archaeon]